MKTHRYVLAESTPMAKLPSKLQGEPMTSYEYRIDVRRILDNQNNESFLAIIPHVYFHFQETSTDILERVLHAAGKSAVEARNKVLSLAAEQIALHKVSWNKS
jgi:hypothetical protein